MSVAVLRLTYQAAQDSYSNEKFDKRNILRFSADYTQWNFNQKPSVVVSLQLVYSYDIDLDSTLLNKDVFQFIKTVYNEGQLKSIQNGVFESFSKLYLIAFDYHIKKLVYI